MSVSASKFVELALAQDGDRYEFGADVDPLDGDPDQFDCSGLVRWICDRLQVDPQIPRGSWMQLRHALAHGKTCSVAEALRTPGALLFFFGSDPLEDGDNGRPVRPKGAHVAISLGDGRTVEARSRRAGVGVFRDARARKWTHAAKIPGVAYPPPGPRTCTITVELPHLRQGDRGPDFEIPVKILQAALHDYDPELAVDGVFGANTEGCLRAYQGARGINEAGAGARTWAALLGGPS